MCAPARHGAGPHSRRPWPPSAHPSQRPRGRHRQRSPASRRRGRRTRGGLKGCQAERGRRQGERGQQRQVHPGHGPIVPLPSPRGRVCAARKGRRPRQRMGGAPWRPGSCKGWHRRCRCKSRGSTRYTKPSTLNPEAVFPSHKGNGTSSTRSMVFLLYHCTAQYGQRTGPCKVHSTA